MSAPPAIVLIGRNEGERLGCALSAIKGYAGQVIYVDSDSTDGSVALAKQHGADVIELDTSTPLSAARGRNAGYERAVEVDPELAYIQFVDGDCEVAEGWLEKAAGVMDDDEAVFVVCGRLHERRPDLNSYHRLLEQEWDMPLGDVESSGGIAMMRVAGLKLSGLFNPAIPAGEEPELCMRLRQQGGKVIRLPDAMAYHDAEMTRLAQWWQRGRRTGFGGLDVLWRTRKSDRLFGDILRSAVIWTLGWLGVLIVVGAVGAWVLPPVIAGVAVLAICAAQPLQWARLTLRQRPQAGNWCQAVAMALLQMVDKWAQLHGMLVWAFRRCTGR